MPFVHQKCSFASILSRLGIYSGKNKIGLHVVVNAVLHLKRKFYLVFQILSVPFIDQCQLCAYQPQGTQYIP